MWCGFKSVSGVVLALGALYVFSSGCLASETPAALERNGTTGLSSQGGGAASLNGDQRPDIVRVEPQGWDPSGFRYRIVLDSATHAATSFLDLTAEEGGLRVIARDVDGNGNDLDLIVKSARSLVHVGVWLNNHRGGFTRIDPSAYATSIWSEGPLVLSDNPPATLEVAGLPSYHSCLYSPRKRCPSEQVVEEVLIKSTDFNLPSRPAAGPHQTRSPPPLLS